jgi:prominin 1
MTKLWGFLCVALVATSSVAADGRIDDSRSRLPDSVADAFASVRDGLRKFKARRVETREDQRKPQATREHEEVDLHGPEAKAVRVLSQHEVRYSEPKVDKRYQSVAEFNPRGMRPVYTISHFLMATVQREGILPAGVNQSAVLDLPPEEVPHALADHWADFLLQYVGVVTAAVCGLLLAVAMPIACLCTCCCRCAGKCGAYPEHFDKRSDSCKRFSLAVALAVLVILATFGVVSAFVTNYFIYEGANKLPDRLKDATSDTQLYLANTGSEVDNLLVTNFKELEEVLVRVLDESGPILKRSLAEVTQAVAIDDLTNIVSNLGTVKRHLREIQSKSQELQDYVGQLRLGLNGTSVRLLSALRKCSQTKACAEFLGEYDIGRDLAVAANFSDLPTKLPDLSSLMEDISVLMENDIESKVRGGQEQLDRVKVDIEKSIGGITPQIKRAIRRMGSELSDQAAEINRFLDELRSHVATVSEDVPSVEPRLKEYSRYYFYIGLGASLMLLLLWISYVFGLFYGFCGKRPGNYYGDDCCNKGTGANW